MKYINKRTGVILEPANDFAEEQLKRNAIYMEYKEKIKEKKERIKVTESLEEKE